MQARQKNSALAAWGFLLLAIAFFIAWKQPAPGPPPVPPGPVPTPIVGGLRVLMVYESSAKMTKEQLAVLYSPRIADYLDAKCKDGKDGWRRFDKDVDLSKATSPWPEIWRDVQPKLRQLPALVIIDGLKGEALPLPETVEAALSLLKKYGG